MLLDNSIVPVAEDLLSLLREAGLKLTTAESCTGGLIAGVLTAVAGSSDVVDRGFVTYSNEAKTEMLGVPAELIARDGAVSASVARAMAQGAVLRSDADVAVSVTGIAGPGGGSADKPVGLVYLAVAGPEGRVVVAERRFGDIGRDQVREETVKAALSMVKAALSKA